MSAAAAQVLSPSRNTAQSSPMGTNTSVGASGKLPEILHITSNSLTVANHT